MSLISADFVPHSLPFASQQKPTSNSSRNFISSCTKPYRRNPLSGEFFSLTANNHTNSQSFEKYSQTHLLDSFKKYYYAQKYDESLPFLEYLVYRGIRFQSDVFMCKRMIKGFVCSDSRKVRIREATKVLQILEFYGEKNFSAYLDVIKGYCKLNLMASAIQLLNRMRNQRISGIMHVYNVIIDSLCKRGKLELALKMLDQFFKDNCKPNMFTYKTLITVSAIHGRWRGAMMLLDDLFSRGFRFRFSLETYHKILEGMCMDGQMDRALDLLKNLPSKGIEPCLNSYNILLRGLLDYGRWNEAEKLFKEMLSRKLEPNHITYGILITSLCRDGMIDEATCLSKLMMESGLRPNIYTVSKVISMYCKEGELEKMGHSLDANEFNVMITALRKKGDTIGALRVVLYILDKGIDPCYATYKSLISCLLKARMVDEAMELCRVMEISDIKPTVLIYNNLIFGLCRACRVDDAIQVLEVMVEKGCLPNESTYMLLIKAIHLEGNQVEALELANSLVLMGAISKETLKKFQENFPIMDTVDSFLLQ